MDDEVNGSGTLLLYECACGQGLTTAPGTRLPCCGVMCGLDWEDRRGNHHVCYLPPGHPTWCTCTCGATMIPVRIDPGLEPDGVVLRLYGIGEMVLVEQRAAANAADDVLDALATRAAEIAAESGAMHGVVTLAGYDGDTGELLMSYEADFT